MNDICWDFNSIFVVCSKWHQCIENYSVRKQCLFLLLKVHTIQNCKRFDVENYSCTVSYVLHVVFCSLCLCGTLRVWLKITGSKYHHHHHYTSARHAIMSLRARARACAVQHTLFTYVRYCYSAFPVIHIRFYFVLIQLSSSFAPLLYHSTLIQFFIAPSFHPVACFTIVIILFYLI